MPEWYMIIGMFATLFTLTLGWGPAVLAGTGLTLAIALPAAQAAMNATRAKLSHFYKGKEVFRSRMTIFTLHLLQPLARLVGRIGGGLTPWRRRTTRIRPKFLSSQMKMWRDRWEPPRSEEHTSELQSHSDLVCRLLLEKKKKLSKI